MIWYDIFFAHSGTVIKEGIVGTTKLTRKEILAEDPVHEAIIHIIEFFRKNSKWIGIAVGVIAIAGFGIYLGMRYLDAREAEAQRQLAKGIEIFQAQVSSEKNEKENPDSVSSTPTFGSEKEKYEAAAKEFSSVASRRGNAKISIIARYYLGLTQLELGQNKEAIASLESVANNSRNPMLGFLAQKVLAEQYLSSQNYKEAEKIFENLIKDPQYLLPKDELRLGLSRALVAQGKQDEAIAVLSESNSQESKQDPFGQQVVDELDRLQRSTNADAGQKPAGP